MSKSEKLKKKNQININFHQIILYYIIYYESRLKFQHYTRNV